jgi:hypothetical protein
VKTDKLPGPGELREKYEEYQSNAENDLSVQDATRLEVLEALVDLM